MKIEYTSLVFKNADGSGRKFMIPSDALSTYLNRDTALLAMVDLGGIHATPTQEFMALRRKMLSAKRKIERNGWHCSMVVA
jgi:hypothetical protein